MKNVNGKYNAEIYTWELENLTEDIVREMKEFIDFDELFERRYVINPVPELSKDFLSIFFLIPSNVSFALKISLIFSFILFSFIK